MSRIFICIVFFISQFAFSQQIAPKIGIVLQFGTHIDRLGGMYQLIYNTHSFGFGQTGAFYYSLKGLGAPVRGGEMNLGFGCYYHYGNFYDQTEFLFNDLSTLTDKKNSFGFISKYYYNKMETSQWVGSLIFRSGDFTFAMENDLFGHKGYQDKYRTAAIAILYNKDPFQYSLKSVLWTGKAINGEWIKESDYPAKHGYKNLEDAKYGKYSHGIFALGMSYAFEYYQVVSAEAGVDAEQIRHALQNKLMHDFMLNEKITHAKNPHYPMLQENGEPFIFKESTKPRSPRYYFQTGLNNMGFY